MRLLAVPGTAVLATQPCHDQTPRCQGRLKLRAGRGSPRGGECVRRSGRSGRDFGARVRELDHPRRAGIGDQAPSLVELRRASSSRLQHRRRRRSAGHQRMSGILEQDSIARASRSSSLDVRAARLIGQPAARRAAARLGPTDRWAATPGCPRHPRLREVLRGLLGPGNILGGGVDDSLGLEIEFAVARSSLARPRPRRPA